MTKKNKSTLGLAIAITFILVSSVILLLFLFHLTNLFFPKPTYHIYQTECVNETEVVGKKLISSEEVYCKLVKVYDNYGELGWEGCYDDEEMLPIVNKYPCDVNMCKYNIKPRDDYYTFYIPAYIEIKDNQPYLKEEWKEITETKETCTQVEVDEMFDFKTPDIDCENYWCWSISKQDLTIEFLDKNCEWVYGFFDCPSHCYKNRTRVNCWDYQDEFCGYRRGLCEKYKCGKYEVVIE